MINYKKPIIEKIGLHLLKLNGEVTDKEIKALWNCNYKILVSILKDMDKLKLDCEALIK